MGRVRSRTLAAAKALMPALGIAGRYYTDGTMAGTLDRALQVTDYLVAEARKAR